MSGHALLPPSSAHRWAVCPGSARMAAAVPGSGSSYADQGTACHTLLSMALDRKIGKYPARVSVVDQALDRAAEVEVTDEMCGWIDRVHGWVTRYLTAHPGSTLHSEIRVHVGRVFGCPDDLWGTADVLINNPAERELVVADAKFGYVEVDLHWAGEAEVDLLSDAEQELPIQRNPQLLLYAMGAANLYGWAHERVRLAVLQPRSEVPEKEHVLSIEALEDEVERMRPLVAAALRPDAPLVVTEEGCRFCPAAAICPALQARAIELARREFTDLRTISLEQLAEIFLKSRQIEAGLKAVRAHATRLLQLGTKVPGLKLVRGSKHRVWKDRDAAREALLGEHALLRSDVVEEKLVSPAEAEKLVGKSRAKLLDPLIEKPVGEPVAAPLDDKRASIAPDFEPVEELV